MSSITQESTWGQLVRFLSRRKYYRYPEEDPNFHIPWEEMAAKEKEKDLEMDSGEEAIVSKRVPATHTPSEAGLTTIPTAHSAAREDFPPIRTRTTTREQTRPFSAERFDVEREEAIERTRSSVIAPQTTADGVTLVDWYTTDDQDNPQNWSSSKKAFVTLQIALYTFVVYCASSIYTPTYSQIQEKFGVGQIKASLGLGMYVIGYGLGPMIFSPLSEMPAVGRNIPYIASFGMFVILAVPTALVDNYAGLLVLRFLTGFMGSPCLATGGATMGDMYGLLKLPYALTAWVSASFCAPALGPLLSGFAVTAKGWRWAFWEVLWMAGPVFVLMFFVLPETSAPNILLRRAQRLRALTSTSTMKSQGEIDQGSASFRKVAQEQMIKPLEIMFKDPAVFFTNVYTSLIYGIYYSYFEAFPLVYIGIYGFNIGELGIVFTCIVVGAAAGIAIYCTYVYLYLEPDIKKKGLRAQEHRLVPALFSSMLLPTGMFLFGWTANAHIHWMASIVGQTLFAMGAFVLFQCIFMYLPLTYPQYAASLFAANDMCRSAMAAGAIVFAHPLYLNLGVSRGISVLAGLLVGGVGGVWALWYFGASLRKRSRFAMS